MIRIEGSLMSRDKEIAKITDGKLGESVDALLPLYLRRTRNVADWLVSRSIDLRRTNARLLKKALRLQKMNVIQMVLSVNAATVTDNYWFRPEGSSLTHEDVRFKENYFDELALRGDPDSFSRDPSRTPELTNIGSFEKCWKLIDGKWYMYKSGNQKEYFSELFICKLGQRLGFDMAAYEMCGEYIRSQDFTNAGQVNFEPMSALIDDDEDYENNFSLLNRLSPRFAEQYLKILWMDTICFNMDRHTENYGFLRDADTGEILSLAPNYDNNIALIARGYPKDRSRQKDGMIRFFREFAEGNAEAVKMYHCMAIPEITSEMLDGIFSEISIKEDADFIKDFILSGQEIVREILRDK